MSDHDTTADERDAPADGPNEQATGSTPIPELDGVGPNVVPQIRLATVDTDADGREHCTIYSVRSRDTLTTTWVSAEEGSFVALDDAR